MPEPWRSDANDNSQDISHHEDDEDGDNDDDDNDNNHYDGEVDNGSEHDDEAHDEIEN